MYRLMLEICSPPERFVDGIDPETVFENPALQEECIDLLMNVSRMKYSCFVSELMDHLGYSYDMIKRRQEIYIKNDELLNRSRPNLRNVITGSKGEGTSTFYESDTDVMDIYKEIECFENPSEYRDRENKTCFEIEISETPAGYCSLKLVSNNSKTYKERITNSLVITKNNSLYLSSQRFRKILEEEFHKRTSNLPVHVQGRSGPATSASHGPFVVDTVVALTCYCSKILENWKGRDRHHGWPSPDTINVISNLPGHVVPVGEKGSQNMHKEWRICYSLAELELMRNMNETQLKVYILLKKICKSVLKPINKDITSYIIKNVVFWISEEKGLFQFTPDLLIDRLIDCIEYLRSCVTQNNLPSYMIPERNLLAGRLDRQQRDRLTFHLNDLLLERGRMFLRDDKLRNAMIVMYLAPDMFREFHQKRDELEYLLHKHQSIYLEILEPDMSEELQNEILAHNADICAIDTQIKCLYPFNKELVDQNTYDTRLCQIESISSMYHEDHDDPGSLT